MTFSPATHENTPVSHRMACAWPNAVVWGTWTTAFSLERKATFRYTLNDECAKYILTCIWRRPVPLPGKGDFPGVWITICQKESKRISGARRKKEYLGKFIA